jgi:hypothetical protein
MRWKHYRERAMPYLLADYTLDIQLYELHHAGPPRLLHSVLSEAFPRHYP